MRISDWSSDVCSSDLCADPASIFECRMMGDPVQMVAHRPPKFSDAPKHIIFAPDREVCCRSRAGEGVRCIADRMLETIGSVLGITRRENGFAGERDRKGQRTTGPPLGQAHDVWVNPRMW